MYVSNQTQERYPWWAGNARFIHLSNTFIVAHVAQAALIMLWAGAYTLFELAVYSPDAPLYTQGLILLPHLATEGWGLSPDGAIVDAGVWSSIGAIHLVAALVLAAGAYFHYTRLPADLSLAPETARKFDFEWQDAGKLGFILGHHLIFLGLGALLLVVKAQYFGGLYDAYSDSVRLVTAPTLDPGAIWDYRTHLFDVRSLEDLVGGHIYVAGLLFIGGVWHILVPPFAWVQRVLSFSGDGILSYSLFGIAIAGFAASYYCGFDSLSYPEKFYGPTLQLQSSLLPRYYEVQPTLADGYTSRVWLANAHFYLAFFFLQGGLWHFQRSVGFDINNLLENWRRGHIEISDSPGLAYQAAGVLQPSTNGALAYGMPQAEAEPYFGLGHRGDYFYQPVQGEAEPNLSDNGVEKTLYQTNYQPQKDSFYQSAQDSDFGYGRSTLEPLYERPKSSVSKPSARKGRGTVLYEPKSQ